LYLSEDSVAIILICSNLAISRNLNLKPYTITEWNKLADKLLDSSVKRPKNLLKLSREELQKELELPDKEVSRLLELLSRGGNLAIELENLRNKGIRIVTRADREYPSQFKEKLKKKSPPVLYYCGDLKLLNTEGIAVVGSRNIDEIALEFTKKLVIKAVEENLTIYSGGAKGVDSVSEEEALKYNGRVVSFIADGLANRIKRKHIREKIMDGQLLVLSAHHPNMTFKSWIAMERNKYVYTLSHAAFVVSADYKKGGTWAGATENVRNNWVKLIVRKEEKLKGNEELLKLGGIPLEDVFENKNFDLKKFIENNEGTTIEDQQEKVVQSSIFDIPKDIKQEDNAIVKDKSSLETKLDNKEIEENNQKNTEQENKSIIEEDKKSEIESDDEKTYDIYYIALPTIKRILKEEKKGDEVARILNVNKKQANDWINRALKDGEIKKLTRPVRYKCI
jgi:predicted Rossmann fold nucleotide-binding protein DprA/Smf involved in DNA uptake